jgi:hypothetical protein
LATWQRCLQSDTSQPAYSPRLHSVAGDMELDQPARLRWAVHVGAWQPGAKEVDLLLSLLPAQEAQHCRAFRQFDDQKRALVSRLLQRHAGTVALGIPFEEVVIKHTKGRKPYIANEIAKPQAPNFNFSVSHEVRGHLSGGRQMRSNSELGRIHH